MPPKRQSPPTRADAKTPRAGQPSICVQVATLIHRQLATDPSIVAVAASMNVNVRTLQRRLSDHGVTYRTLLDDIRRQRAEAELRRHTLTIAEISKRLGYSDPAHFVRAFRRWTGGPPSRFDRPEG